jgi:hypothetical protein
MQRRDKTRADAGCSMVSVVFEVAREIRDCIKVFTNHNGQQLGGGCPSTEPQSRSLQVCRKRAVVSASRRSVQTASGVDERSVRTAAIYSQEQYEHFAVASFRNLKDTNDNTNSGK